MKAPLSPNYSVSIFNKSSKNNEVTLNSALAICQEATLLAYNCAIQLYNHDSLMFQSAAVFFSDSINELDRNIDQLTEIAYKKKENPKAFHLLSNHLQELSAKFKTKD